MLGITKMSSNQKNGRTSKPTVGRSNGRKRRRPFIASPFLRGMTVCAALGMTLFASWAFIKSVARPYVLGAQQSRILTDKQSELDRINAENEQMSQQSKYLSRPDGQEAAARMNGYLRPGEQSLVIQPAAAADSSSNK
jgi:hypothetical protein